MKKIGSRAFLGCTGLKTVAFPNSLEEIGPNNFYGESDNIYQSSKLTFGSGAFSGNYMTELTLGSGLFEIEELAFCSNRLSELTIPATVKEIGERAFAGNRLLELDIPATVEYLGKSSFRGNSLNTLTLHSGIEVIDDKAFCDNYLKEVKILNTVEYLGRYSFGYKSVRSSDSGNTIIEQIKDFKIIGIDYSKADKYAQANGFKFESSTTTRTPGDSSSDESEEYIPIEDVEVPISYKDDFVSGDVNGDGTVDIEDAVLIINNINGVKALTDDEIKSADIDKNGYIDIEDAVSIINHVNGVSVIN